MNLKESFRYQKFLDRMMAEATYYVGLSNHCLKTTKIHHKSEANPEAQDATEVVEQELEYNNTAVIFFMETIVNEKEQLTHAINVAKQTADFDIDAALAANKLRQAMCSGMRRMMSHTPSKTTGSDTGYKFNAEGNQVPYRYSVEIATEYTFDHKLVKHKLKTLTAEANQVSIAVDTVMTTTEVEHEPLFDVNDSFEDAMEEFLKQCDQD